MNLNGNSPGRGGEKDEVKRGENGSVGRVRRGEVRLCGAGRGANCWVPEGRCVTLARAGSPAHRETGQRLSAPAFNSSEICLNSKLTFSKLHLNRYVYISFGF